MATSKFILQGFTTETHVDALKCLFEVHDVQNVLIGVAFVTEGGVKHLEGLLVPHATQATVFAGIRNDVTSYQGLARLHRTVGQLYTVDTGLRALIFHPKLYLVRGRTRARMIIGSANLTVSGLNNNVEAGMLLDFDLTDAADEAEINRVEMLFSTSLTDYPRNIVKVTNVETLDELLSQRRLVDENEQSSARNEVKLDNEQDAYDSQNEGEPRCRRHSTDKA